MTLLWTTPKDWATKDAITKEELNKISDDLRYLYNPSRGIATVRGTGSNQTTNSATFVDLDAATYSLSVELSGARDVYVELQGTHTHNTLGNFTYFDIFIDNSIYLSSLTATPVTFGAMLAGTFVVNTHLPIVYKGIIPAGSLSAGVHTFKPRWRTSGGIATWIELNGWSQFRVGE